MSMIRIYRIELEQLNHSRYQATKNERKRSNSPINVVMVASVIFEVSTKDEI